MNSQKIFRGDVWLINLNPGMGHEQSGIRPALIISDDLFNNGLSGLIIVLPITSKRKGLNTHIQIQANFLPSVSYIKTEDIRSVSVQRLFKRIGHLDQSVLLQAEYHLRYLLGFV